MNDNEKSLQYTSGAIDALKLYGTVCGNSGSCEGCPVVAAAPTGMNCTEFAKQFPEKFYSILQDMSKREYTYYNEFNVRFPACSRPVEELAQVCCRKAVFEGYVGCEGSPDPDHCVKCWLEQYAGDITENVEEKTESFGESIFDV